MGLEVMVKKDSILIRNVEIPLHVDKEAKRWDILIVDGTIRKVVPSSSGLKSPDGVREFNGQGYQASAGFIDMHAHLRYPGQTYREDLFSGSRAAARGGFTSVVTMANTNPPIDNPEIVTNIVNRARDAECVVNVFPVGAVTMGQKGEYLTDFLGLKKAGVIALSDDGVPISNSKLMVDALKLSRTYDILLLLHEEDKNLSNENIIREGEISYELGIPGYHSFSEELMVIRDLHLCEKIGGRIHLCHLSSRYALPHVAAAKAMGLHVSAEVTPHHLYLTSECLRNYDPNYKMSPPLGHPEDQEALLTALREGIIDCVATDHAPHAYHEKDLLLADANCGITGLETAFGVLCDLVQARKVSLDRVITSLTSEPAKILGLERKGRLEEGCDGDVVVFNTQEQWTYKKEEVCSKSLNSPFLDKEFYGSVRATFVSGSLVYDNKKGER